MYKFGVAVMIIGALFTAISFFLENYRERKISLGIFVTGLGTLLASLASRQWGIYDKKRSKNLKKRRYCIW